MRINDITIKNFRGFTEKYFEFDPKMNVVLGDNTTGKTTLLHAMQISLGAYLQELTLISGCAKNVKDSDVVKKYSEATKSFQKSASKPVFSVNSFITESNYNLNNKNHSSEEKNVKWTRTSPRNSRINAGELMDIVAEMDHKRRTADETQIVSVLPILLSFGASRLENNYNGAEKTKVRASREENAYKCALDEKVDFKSAFDWIYRFDKELAKNREFERTDEAFLNTLYEAIPSLKKIEIDRKNNEFTAQIQMTKDAEPYWLTYDMMSAGFKSMINIVAEIAYRCIQLNGFLGIDAVKKTPGIIMIDEVDLYLHPHWQQHVLIDLQAAFPEIQFIVSTHSPFIVQSVDSQNVIVLDNQFKNNISPSNRGIEEIATMEMGLGDDLSVRSKKYVDKYNLASEYYTLVKDGTNNPESIGEVRTKLEELERKAHLFHDPAFEAALKLKRGDL